MIKIIKEKGELVLYNGFTTYMPGFNGNMPSPMCYFIQYGLMKNTGGLKLDREYDLGKSDFKEIKRLKQVKQEFGIGDIIYYEYIDIRKEKLKRINGII